MVFIVETIAIETFNMEYAEHLLTSSQTSHWLIFWTKCNCVL